jgi:hypothetical protein
MKAQSDWSSLFCDRSDIVLICLVAGYHLATGLFRLYHSIPAPAARDPRAMCRAVFLSFGGRAPTILWAAVGLWLPLFAPVGKCAAPVLFLLTHIGTLPPRLLLWELVSVPWRACKLTVWCVRVGLRLAVLLFRLLFGFVQQCTLVTLYRPRPDRAVEAPPGWPSIGYVQQFRPLTFYHQRPEGIAEAPPGRSSILYCRVYAASVWLRAGYHVATRYGWTLPLHGRLRDAGARWNPMARYQAVSSFLGTQVTAILREIAAWRLPLNAYLRLRNVIPPIVRTPPVWMWAVPVFLLLVYITFRPRRPLLRAPASRLWRACEKTTRNASAGLELVSLLLPAARQVRCYSAPTARRARHDRHSVRGADARGLADDPND